MAGNVNWNGAACQQAIHDEMTRRIKAACIYLTSTIKADISQPGTLRYQPTLKSGKTGKAYRTIYNFTHSLPGNPPYKQTGHLRRSMMWEVEGLEGRVGTNLEYGDELERGSPRVAARPFILPNFLKHRISIEMIVNGTMLPGGLPEIRSNQFRSGVIGMGGKLAGYG